MCRYAVPANKCGLVIGKGGKTIKNINQISGAYVTLSALPSPNSQEKFFVIRGQPPQIEHAKELINERIGGIGTVSVHQDLAESEKLKQLKEQAEKWSYSTVATYAVTSRSMTTVIAPNVSVGALASTNVTQFGITQQVQIQMTKEEEEFEKQFKDWEKKFETWKQENQNHPDKEAFAQYEKQWQEYHEQLLQQKEQMQRSKAQQLASSAQATVPIQTFMQTSVQASTAPSVTSTSTNDSSYTDITAATAATPEMYYQYPQYVYIQPYMYPDAMPLGAAVVSPAVLPSAIVPLSVVPSVGVPPVSMPPMMPPTDIPPQNLYNTPPPQDSYNQQPCQGMPGPGLTPVPRPADTMGQHNNMNYDNCDMFNCGPPGQRNEPRDDGIGQQNYEGFVNPNMNMGEECKNYNCGDDLASKQAQPISQNKNLKPKTKKLRKINLKKTQNNKNDEVVMELKQVQPISQDNIDYRLHQKQGLSISKDFGRIEQGCHDPISSFVKDDMNFGRGKMETNSAEECTKKRHLSETEEQDSCDLQQEYEKQKELEEKNYWINVVSKWRKVDCEKEKVEPLKKLDVRPNWIDVVSKSRKVDDCEKGRKAEPLKKLDVRPAPIVKRRHPVGMGTGEKFIHGGGFREITDDTLESGNQEENTNDCEENSPINSYDSAFFEDTSYQSNGNESDFHEDLESEMSNQFLKDAEALCDELENEISYEINLKEAEALCNELESKEICYNDPVVKGSPIQNVPLTNDLDILFPEDDVESSKLEKYGLKCTVESAARLKYALDDLRYLYMNTIFFTPDDVDLPPLPDDCVNMRTINFTPCDANFTR